MQPLDISSIGTAKNDKARSNGFETALSETQPPALHSSGSGPQPDPYRGVVLVLLVAAVVGLGVALEAGLRLGNPVLVDTALTLGLAAGILAGVAQAQAARLRSPKEAPEEAPEPQPEVQTSAVALDAFEKIRARASSVLSDYRASLQRWPWYRKAEQIGFVRVGTAAVGLIAVYAMLRKDFYPPTPTPLWAAIVAGLCVIAAGLAATAAHYLASVDPAQLPESPALCRGSRVIAWLLLMTAVSIGLAWRGLPISLDWLAPRITLRLDAFCRAGVRYSGLYRAPDAQSGGEMRSCRRFPLDIGVLSVFGSRNNILASVLDAAERQLGIDLRSTWALTVVRRSLEPLVIGLLLAAWLSTSLTVVGPQEQGLVERLGVPVGGQPLEPGLHLHWPWPLDRVFRIPVKRVQSLTVGHEGQEEGGPENVLWAREHAANEYTLLLGNGRDLITDRCCGAFRIVDARAWRYHCQNPADALRAIAYRAVMRYTVNRTLSDALSENVATLTAQMRAMVQQDADALGLGVQVVAFTVGGMHPPVPVAPDYQAVVSAELGKVTATVNAQAYRNQTVPAAEASVLSRRKCARAEGAEALAPAAGEAWSFPHAGIAVSASPEEYLFRRRLETLEKGLRGA